MAPYLPQSGAGGGGSPYSKGAALYALGLIHANHGEGTKQCLRDSIRSTSVELFSEFILFWGNITFLPSTYTLWFDYMKRPRIEYEKKMHASNLEQREVLHKNIVSMAREMEKLCTELADAEKTTRAAAVTVVPAPPVEIFIPVEEAEQERGIFHIEGWMVGLNGSKTEATHLVLESENQQILPLQYVLVCTDEYGRRGQAPIRDDESMLWIYRGAHLRPALYVEVADEPVQDVGEGTSGGQYDGAGSSGVGGTNEDDDDTEDDVHGNSDEEYVPSDEFDDDYSDHGASSVVISIFDDISDMDKSELDEDSDGITMWDGNWQTVRYGVHFANKKEVQTAVGEWTLRQGRACRVKYSRPYMWATECETKGPKYPEELLHGTTCLWKCRATLQKDTNTWRMVV
ncbi:OLC1v1013448C1 [Oldenlandia corymbosa var. corymbosa]|uniref:OLC1v1013448C1 n=1 Tax=Oldenlandia corymbosa var. corymbosa TaxID=529605 RepID=A0AAV1E0E5_OLDCO|nr:OLC1v1013448C1 [Oldenlandia corymbosa var. corymbosa]